MYDIFPFNDCSHIATNKAHDAFVYIDSAFVIIAQHFVLSHFWVTYPQLYLN